MHPEQLSSTAENIPSRIFALKSRISAKKIEADLLFSNINNENSYQLEQPLTKGSHEEGLH